MRASISLLSLIATVLLIALPLKFEGVQTSGDAYLNGFWFDGAEFVQRDYFVVNGLLTSTAPGSITATHDLSDKYVIPPYGDAHNHNIDNFMFSETVQSYLESGVFYVKNPNSLPRFTEEIIDGVNIPESVEATFAGGGLTATGGHPLGLVQRNLERGVFLEGDGEGAFVHVIDTLADLDAKWNEILAGQPDFIKTYLLYSEEYELRRDDDAFFAWKGLNPELLPEIVKRAHEAGLRVSTHIETATDFRNAVLAGVDEINHMVGFRPNGDFAIDGGFPFFDLSAEDAALAAERGVVVVTTIAALLLNIELIPEGDPLFEVSQALKAQVIRNLELLRDHGVIVAIGSDEYDWTSHEEALALHNLGIYTNLELLKMWTENTAKTILPHRSVGELKDGFEASFLVLTGNPLEDFSETANIEMRVKDGVLLEF